MKMNFSKGNPKVKVTMSDIRKGKKKDMGLCPVSIALERATGFKWQVDIDCMESLNRDLPVLIKTPPELAVWINSYDLGNKVEPIAFAFNPYDQSYYYRGV